MHVGEHRLPIAALVLGTGLVPESRVSGLVLSCMHDTDIKQGK